MPIFEKKNPLVEAIQWTGDNFEELEKLILDSPHAHLYHISVYMDTLFFHGSIDASSTTRTLSVGSWLVKDEDGYITISTDREFSRDYRWVTDNQGN